MNKTVEPIFPRHQNWARPAYPVVDTERASSSLLSLLAYMLAIAILFYIFTFNFMPTDIRLIYAGVINLGYAGLYVLAFNVRRPGPILCIIGLLGMTLVEMFNGSGTASEVGFAVLRQFSSLIGYAAFLMLTPLVLSIRQTRGLAVVVLVCVILALFQSLTNPPVEVSDTYRLGSVTGGLDLMHPSAYAVAGITLMCLFLAFSRQFNPRLGATMLPFWGIVSVLLLFTLEGFGVRTIFVMLASFVVFYLVYTPRNRTVIATAIPVVLVLFLFFAVFVVDKTFWVSISDLGSGRIGAYIQRFEIFASREFPQRMLGTGIGSDYFFGKYEWRHGEKDSHNDYLSMLIELGVVGLGFFVVYAVGLFMLSKDRLTFAITSMILLSSLVSNAALFRPNLGTLFGITALLGRSVWAIQREVAQERKLERLRAAEAGAVLTNSLARP